MKTRAFFFGRLLLPAAALISFSGSAQAVTKLNNTTALNAAGSWLEATAPLATDVLLFDSAITGPLSVAVGASGTVGGSLQFTNIGGNVAITQSAGQTWTLGNGGVNMSAATADVTLGTTGATIRWASANYAGISVASGRTLTFNSNVSNQGNTKTLAMTGGGNVVFNGTSNGAGGAMSMSVQGGTNVTMNGSWTGGGREVIAGTLNLGSDTALNGTLNLGGTNASNPTITASGGARTMVNGITLLAVTTGNATVAGSNNLTVNGVLTVSGANRALTVNNSGLTTFGGAVNLSESASNRTLTINGSGTTSVTGVVANGSTSTAGNLTYSGAGTLALSNANTFAGTLTATSGTTRLDHSQAAQNATVSVGAANALAFGTGITSATFGGLSGSGGLALTNGDTNAVALSVGNNNASTTYSGALSGGGSITKTGTGTLSVSNTSNAVNYLVTGGTLRGSGTTANTNGGFGTGAIELQGGALNAAMSSGNTLSFGNALTVAAGQTGTFTTPERMTWTGNVSGAGTLNIGVTTTISRFDLHNSWTGFTGNANFTGSGAVRLFNNGGNFNTASFQSTALDLAGSVSFNPQTNSGGNTYQIGALSGSSATAALGGGSAGRATYAVGALNTSTSFAGMINGNAALTKTGSGTQTLSGANTYTGATSVTAGTLALGATGSIDNTSGVYLGTGDGTFDVSAKEGGYSVARLTGSGNVTGALTVSTQLAIGNSPGTIAFSDDLTIGATSTYTYELTSGGTAADLGDVAGDLTIAAGAILDLVQLGTYTANEKFTLFAYDGALAGTFIGMADHSVFTAAGGDWMIDYDDTTAGANGGTGNAYVTITAIPEPAAALLGGLGLLTLLRRRRGN